MTACMTASSSPHRFLTSLREDTLREIAASKAHLVDIWNLPLKDRVEKGHTLGPLKVISQKEAIVILAHETNHSRESFSRIREGDLMRLTQDDPIGKRPFLLFPRR